jgi:hypothetical protein
MADHYVTYTVSGTGKGDGEYQTGPYPSWEAAAPHLSDIKGYVGIAKCYITTVRYPEMKLIEAAA